MRTLISLRGLVHELPGEANVWLVYYYESKAAYLLLMSHHAEKVRSISSKLYFPGAIWGVYSRFFVTKSTEGDYATASAAYG